MVINEKDIELSKPNRFPPITVKQGDNARQITARLFNDGEQFLVASGLGVRLNAKRSDGQKNYSTGWVNADGTVTVPITSWMVAVVGTVTCDISVFISGQQVFTTTNFYLNVEEATNKDGVVGGNDTPVDEQFAEIVLQIENYTEQARQYSETAKQYAAQASTVNHIIEQNSGVPVKVWATNNKNEFDGLEKTEENTLYIYPTNVVDVEQDENGRLRIGDSIISHKKLLWKSETGANLGANFTSENANTINAWLDIFTHTESLIGKKLEFELKSGDNISYHIVKLNGQLADVDDDGGIIGFTNIVENTKMINSSNSFEFNRKIVSVGISINNVNKLCGKAYSQTTTVNVYGDLGGGSSFSIGTTNGAIKYLVCAIYEVIE